MSERDIAKTRKSPASKALPSKQPVKRKAAAKKAAPAGRKSPTPKASKSKTPAQRAVSQSAALDGPALLSRVVALETERERLLAELAQAQARIKTLEDARDQVLNRIDWVIDSLRSLIEEGH